MQTKTDIINQALLMAGQDTILDPAGESKNAKLMAQIYDATLEEAGLSYTDIGYADFDAMLGELVPPETFGSGIEIEGLEGKAVDYIFEVKNAAAVDPERIMQLTSPGPSVP